ncbi:cytochrome c [Labrenzia sp. DG1229]|uniref:c-type cytochrome n=1 Tax=Labrenzia sp. DG1229 TaxID=681847 RepID=UPI00048DE9EB|nr:cytochrome c [Labrenzia sp. DG1229]
MKRIGSGVAVAVLLAAFLAGAVTWRSQSVEDARPAETGASLVQVTEPELLPVALEGKSVFRANCAACHGNLADGREGLGPPLVHKIYEPGHHGDAAFFLAAAQGVRSHHWPFGDMPPVTGVSQDDVRKIVAYVRTLQQANGIY